MKKDRRWVRWAGAILLVLLLVAGAAWLFRVPLAALWGPEEITEVSPEAAVQAEAKLQRLEEEAETVRLSSVELSSLLRYRAAEQLPGGIREPTISLSGDTVWLDARVALADLPDAPGVKEARAFLPDTAPVKIAGRLAALSRGRGQFEVYGLTVAGLPVPPRLYRPALERLGRADEPGLAENAIPVRLPPGAQTARVENGALVLSPEL